MEETEIKSQKIYGVEYHHGAKAYTIIVYVKANSNKEALEKFEEYPIQPGYALIKQSVEYMGTIDFLDDDELALFEENKYSSDFAEFPEEKQ